MATTGSVSSGTGLISGTDYSTLISKLMSVEEQPLTTLKSKISVYEVKLSAYGTLKSNITSLQTAVENLTSSTDGFNQLTATSGNSSLVSVSTDSTATQGTYDIKVNSLAQQQKLKSTTFGTSEAVGAGTLHLTIGEDEVDVTVSSTDTINDVADAINAAGLGVTATVINDGTNDVLTLKANDTGTANTMTITVTDSDGDNTDDSGLSRLYYEGDTGGQMTQTQEAKDASITLDGVTITRSSNTIDDALTGVTITVKAASVDSSSETTITVGPDTSSVQSDINAFVTAYNNLLSYISTEQSYTAASGSTSASAGTLLGDTTTNMIRDRLSSFIRDAVGGVSGFRHLSDLGITVDTDGQLEVDSDTLSAALSDHFDSVKSFFTQSASSTASEGFASRMADTIDSWVDDTDGTVTTKTEGLQTTIDKLNDQADAMQTRLDSVEERYTAQFNALETLLATYQTTSSAVDSLIAAMDNLNTQIANNK